ncbi:hypothetical protein C2845_PM09G14200 [Panicum miliaceum]|uniref:Uncharacterized protein n=1 Tax=Panicum miliaceum TaxID=4540 RepID=A0A3L6RYC6_PANMI|nr:hypothetical protein C2845_PM09G14200 [Panicum miliaceum]
MWEEEEVGVVVHARVANKVADVVESAVVEEKKPEIEGEKAEEVVDVPTSEASTVVANEGCIEDTVPASANSVLKDSLEIEQYSEGLVTANKVVEDVCVEKPSEVENVVAIEDVDVKKYIEVEHVAVIVEGVDVVKLMMIENVAATSANRILSQELAPESSKKINDAKKSECSTEVIDHEEEIDNDGIIKAVADEDGVGYEAYEYNDGANSDTSPAWIAILRIMKKFVEGSSSGSVSGSRDFTNSMDGQIMLDDCKEDDDNDDGDKKRFDSVALAALLEGETSGTSYGNITLSSQDGSKILTMDGPAHSGSSTPSLMPTTPCQHARSNAFSPAELAVTTDPTEEMTEEEKNLHDKVESVRVKFLRLVYKLGATFEEIVTSLVLYRLSLVEGIMHVHGRQTNQDFSLDNAWKKALILQEEGKEDLNFSCNILVLGKIGVGKSATINSIFGEDKSKIDAFSSATTSVREYVGDVHGIKIRIIDTPGFQTSVMDQGSNRKILATIKKYTKKCPPDIVLAHPKLSPEQGGNEGDFHIKLDEYSNVQHDDEEEKQDRLPPFKTLTKAQLARLTRKQKKQWKNEICKLKEMKKRGEIDLDDYGYANIAGENDQNPPLDNVSVPLPNIVLPPSFDCNNPTYRYHFLEPTSTILARPISDAHGWDHDYGYDGVSMEETLAILDRFPANVAVQVTKDKKKFSIHLDSSIATKHGENASSLVGLDIQAVGLQPAYILHGETKIKNIKKNETTGGFSVTFLGDIVATGLKVEDRLSLGKRLSLVASTGAMQAQGDTAYTANLEACLKDKHYPIGQSTLDLSLMKWGRDLALGANLQSQFSIRRGSKIALRLGINNKLSGQITIRTSTSEQVQIALLGLVPVAASIYRSFHPSEPSSV